MADRSTIEAFLAQRRIVFVGASRDPGQFANAVYRHLRDNGRVLVPVNANGGGEPIEGDPSYTDLAQIPGPLGAVLVMVPAANAAAVVDAAVAGGATMVWLHRGMGAGAVSEEAVRRCREAGVAVVDGACPLMFDAPVRGIHRLHRALSRTGRRAA